MSTRGPRTDPAAALQVLLATSLFGTIGTARALGPQAPAAAVGAARTLVAAVVLLGIVALVGDSVRAVLRRPTVLVAGVAQAGFQVTFLAAVPRTGVAIGTLLAIGSAPMFSGLLHRRVDRTWVIATSLSVLGLILLVVAGSASSTSPTGLQLTGVLLALGAGLSYAAYTVSTGRAVMAEQTTDRHAVSPTAVTAATFVVAAALLSPSLLLTDLSWLGTGPGLAMVAWLALAPTVLSYLLLARGLRTLPAPVVSTLGLAEPLVATVLGVWLLAERPGPTGWVGAVLVLAGLAVAAAGASRRKASGVLVHRGPAADSGP